ncbi:uncharacterized protein PAN0_013d4644 [Moesziomyces antarcticus]|uniref:Uncharacterized protein n=2 Tax=Pseudozyma antarctica TaxID=84753 RepID=A0A081CIC6_PSEA2|nr:uncharacterized protein PAN0_013d4644 [Moesziomyces antarcticus]GAK66422.1 conserved hypothetical protein [Moesziomyces antarcticus]SPO47461.1 uncharacterized protein PSANT_05149 [Moesziomyces antarcticus]
MLLRPSPGRARAVTRSAAHTRRPRPSTALNARPTPTSRIALLYNPAHMRAVSHRCYSSAARAPQRSTLAVLKKVLLRATHALRTGALRHATRVWTPRHVFAAIKIAAPHVRSSLLRGAADVFRATSSQNTARAAYSRFTSPSVGFARGGLSGIGARPAGGQLALSPLRGGVGLQSARQFSSGGARVFDNLVVNAPLALRLAADEIDDKAKLARRPPATPRRLGAAPNPRRTGTTFSTAKLARNAAVFAATPRSIPSAPSARSVAESCPSVMGDEEPAEMGMYFRMPPPNAEVGTVVRMRLIDPLYDALGGRDPAPGLQGRLFDRAFLHDACTALQYEHARYMHAKALLRVLWTQDLLDGARIDMEDPAMWIVHIPNACPGDVRSAMGGVEFGWTAWCDVEGWGEGLDWSCAWGAESEHSYTQTSQEDDFEMLDLSLPVSSAEGVSERSSSLYDSRASL